MSSTPLNRADFLAPSAVDRISSRSLVIGVLGAVVSLVLAFVGPDAASNFYHSYLLAYIAWTGVMLGSLALLIVIHLTNGRWGLVIRRILEAAVQTWPLMLALFFPLAFGVSKIYPWAMPVDASTPKETQEWFEWIRGYLNPSMFLVRGLIYFAMWILLAVLFVRWSREEDQPGNRSHDRSKALAAPGALLFAFALTFSNIDWVMSLQSKWISTIYPLIFLIGPMISALCLATITAYILARYRPMSDLLQPGHLHDYGKFMLAFTMLWAYFSFSQWLIQWAGNLPEEIAFYKDRLQGGWQYVGLMVAILGFVVPFTLLLSAQLKKDGKRLVNVAIWLLLMRFVDLFWHIMPNFSRGHISVHLTDVVVPVAMGGLWLAFFFRNLKGQALLPLHAPLTQAVLEPAHD